MHDVLPVRDEYWPKSHFLQELAEEDPTLSEKVPVLQELQLADELDPIKEDHVPAMQPMHTEELVAAVVVAQVPGKHLLQALTEVANEVVE